MGFTVYRIKTFVNTVFVNAVLKNAYKIQYLIQDIVWTIVHGIYFSSGFRGSSGAKPYLGVSGVSFLFMACFMPELMFFVFILCTDSGALLCVWGGGANRNMFI